MEIASIGCFVVSVPRLSRSNLLVDECLSPTIIILLDVSAPIPPIDVVSNNSSNWSMSRKDSLL